MSLQVNLLIPSEQRSASPINLKLLVRLAYLAVPAGVLLVIASAVIDLLTLKSELHRLEERWGELEPRKKAAQQEQVVIMRNRDILAELQGWRNSQMLWHAALSNVCDEVPASTQIQTLTISQDTPLLGKQVPARVFRLQVAGKAKGSRSEQDIQTLSQRLGRLECISSARVSNYRADYSQGAEEDDRVFSIVCEFVARKFE